MEVLGNRVVILPDEVETTSAGGIITMTDAQIQGYRDQTTTGVVIDYGPAAWLDPIMGGEPWVKKGDRVVYAKHAGKLFKVPGDDKEYVCVNDDALQVRI